LAAVLFAAYIYLIFNCARIAGRKGYSYGFWLFMAIILNIWAFIIIIGLRPKITGTLSNKDILKDIRNVRKK